MRFRVWHDATRSERKPTWEAPTVGRSVARRSTKRRFYVLPRRKTLLAQSGRRRAAVSQLDVKEASVVNLRA